MYKNSSVINLIQFGQVFSYIVDITTRIVTTFPGNIQLLFEGFITRENNDILGYTLNLIPGYTLSF
jgi:hypothetical protein